MKKFFLFLLATSLTANAWLFLSASSFPSERITDPSPAKPLAAERTRAMARNLPVAAVRALSELETGDLAAVRDNLRAAGMDESSIRGILDGALRARHMKQVEAARGAPGGAPVPSLRDAVREPLRQLLGVDPLDVVDAEARYDFLPEEKRRMLGLIDLDYSDLRARSAPGRSGSATKAELDEQKLLADERRKDVLAALTPEERAEYDLRFSREAVYNSRRFAALGVTEQEFRALQPLIAEMIRKSATLGGLASVERAALEQATVDRLVAAVGYDRALDYMWGNDSGPYRSTLRLLQNVNQPTGNAAKLLQLASETGVTAAAIHRDSALTAEQKRTALLTLQKTLRPQIDALVPPTLQSKLDQEAIGWFTGLGEGRYQERLPVLYGVAFASSGPISVTTPPVGSPLPIPVPRRGGK